MTLMIALLYIYIAIITVILTIISIFAVFRMNIEGYQQFGVMGLVSQLLLFMLVSALPLYIWFVDKTFFPQLRTACYYILDCITK